MVTVAGFRSDAPTGDTIIEALRSDDVLLGATVKAIVPSCNALVWSIVIHAEEASTLYSRLYVILRVPLLRRQGTVSPLQLQMQHQDQPSVSETV